MHIKQNPFLWITFWLVLTTGNALSQQEFGTACAGNWKGMMHLFKAGALIDSVPLVLEINQKTDSVFQWKMQYLSEKMPVTKDYLLVFKGGNYFRIDEGNGIQIDAYLFSNRLVSQFETEGILLTSTYELRGDELYFEVTSGTKEKSDADVQSYHVGFLQHVRFKRY